MSIPPVEGFDQYRNERKRRHLDSGPKRHAAQNSTVLRELEAHEASAARNERMNREVQEFFEDATRTAATMVSKLATSAEDEQNASVAREMSDFLNETLRRARAFIEEMQAAGGSTSGIEELWPNLRNVVGPTLDAYRWEGSPGAAEGQIGRDPFSVENDMSFASDSEIEDDSRGFDDDIVEVSVDADFVPIDGAEIETDPQRAAAPIEEHLVAEFVESSSPAFAGPVSFDAINAWAARVGSNDEALRLSLKALVHVGSMTKDEARHIYQELRSLRSN